MFYFQTNFKMKRVTVSNLHHRMDSQAQTYTETLGTIRYIMK